MGGLEMGAPMGGLDAKVAGFAPVVGVGTVSLFALVFVYVST